MKLNKFFHLSALFIFLSFNQSCNYNRLKNSVPDIEQNSNYGLPVEKIKELGYSKLSETVFKPYCISCHGTKARVNLETYSEVIKYLSSIQKVVFNDKSMPKNTRLSQDELSYLWNWIKIGAPEKSELGDPIVNDPLIATFDSINKNVFQITCIKCHNPNGTGLRVLLDKEALLHSPRELVLPGNPDESGLVLALERTDDNRMPPASDGYAEVSENVKLIIRSWITNGAID